MTDTPFELFKSSSRRSQSATPGYRSKKYREYLKKLEEKNKLLHNSKDENLKQRENGFQLYVNGAHSVLPRRPPTVLRKRTENNSFNRIQTPAPFFSKLNLAKDTNRRRRWSLTTQTKIKTEQGSIIADIDSPQSPSNIPVDTHITYRLNVDQSWMPDWYSQIKPNLSLSLDDIPTTVQSQQQQTYRLSTRVGKTNVI